MTASIYTSYFANKTIHTREEGNDDTMYHVVSIARTQPNWLTKEFSSYSAISPSYQLLTDWKNSEKDEKAMVEYIRRYYATTLNIYGEDSPIIHAENLLAFAKKFKDDDKPMVLTCWESIGKFCHRVVYATYLQLTTGMIIPELGNSSEKPTFIQEIITTTLQRLIRGGML